jgi:hypothetical protein
MTMMNRFLHDRAAERKRNTGPPSIAVARFSCCPAEVRGTLRRKREVNVAKRRTNFSFEKRRKEEERKKKRAEKTQARRERNESASAGNDAPASEGTGEPSADPGTDVTP